MFLCASTLESVRILFNSSTSEIPHGLANSSGEMGHNLMDHVKIGGADATIPGNEDHIILGRRPNGIYVPRFRNVKTKQTGFLRGYGFEGEGVSAKVGSGESVQTGFGPDFKKSTEPARPVAVHLWRLRRVLAESHNLVELDKEKVDAWGIPVLKINCAWSENELAMRKDMSISAAEMLAAAGGIDIEPFAETSRRALQFTKWERLAWAATPGPSVLNSTIRRTM